MKRIMVMGVSAGAGKSTFARKLGKLLNVDVYHLDTFFWKPGWQQTSVEEFSQKQREVVTQEDWIIEGNYRSTFNIRAKEADILIYLEVPLIVCLYRVFKRWWTHRGKTRGDIGEGCKEKIDYEFIKFIVTTYHSRKKNMKNVLDDFRNEDKKVAVQLTSRRAIQSFLEKMEKTY